jgi:hypothetical protein
MTPKSIHPDYKHMEHVEQEVLRCFVGISSFHAFPGDGTESFALCPRAM